MELWTNVKRFLLSLIKWTNTLSRAGSAYWRQFAVDKALNVDIPDILEHTLLCRKTSLTSLTTPSNRVCFLPYIKVASWGGTMFSQRTHGWRYFDTQSIHGEQSSSPAWLKIWRLSYCLWTVKSGNSWRSFWFSVICRSVHLHDGVGYLAFNFSCGCFEQTSAMVLKFFLIVMYVKTILL